MERTKENETKMSGGRKWKRGGEIKQESGFDFSLLPFGFEITSLLFFCFKRFFIFFLLSWQWLLIFATFSFGFLSCFLHAAAALALFSDAFVVGFLFVFVLHISADVVLADFSFFFSKKERCILSIEVNVCDFLCLGKGG